MNRSKRILHYSVIAAFAMTLAACAGKSSPIALQPVQPDNGNPGFTTEGNISSTLLDAVVKQGVPRALATLAFGKFDQFSSLVTNRKYISIIDFTQYSGSQRYYMINVASGHVDKLLVAHGVGSDPKNTGLPTKFSNLLDSKMSSLGSYLVNEIFESSEHGKAARLDGLESSNSLARLRGLILHSADYVTSSRDKMGRSWGCPAIGPDWIKQALSRLSDGSFMYIYGKNKSANALEEPVFAADTLNPYMLDAGED